MAVERQVIGEMVTPDGHIRLRTIHIVDDARRTEEGHPVILRQFVEVTIAGKTTNMDPSSLQTFLRTTDLDLSELREI